MTTIQIGRMQRCLSLRFQRLLSQSRHQLKASPVFLQSASSDFSYSNFSKSSTCVSARLPHTALRRMYSTETASAIPVVKDEDLGKLVYKGNANKTVRIIKLFSITTSIMGVCLQPMLFKEMGDSALAFKVAAMTATAFFVFGTPLLLHFLSKRYVLQMYFNENTRIFTAERYNIFAQPKKFSFTAEQISDSIPNPFSNFQVGSHGFLLDTDKFRNDHPEAYKVFMRYDEPLDVDKYNIKKVEEK